MRVHKDVATDGFTIIETMLFLAISSVFLLIAFTFLGPITQRAQFRVGVDRMVQSLNDVVNDIESGYYGSSSSNYCRYITAGNRFEVTATDSSANEVECALMGRVLSFSIDESIVTTYPVLATDDATDITSDILKTPASGGVDSIEASYGIRFSLPSGSNDRSVAVLHNLQEVVGLSGQAEPEVDGLIIKRFNDEFANGDSVSIANNETEDFEICLSDDRYQALLVFGHENGNLRAQALHDADAARC